jgi:hypothetical protein
MLFPHSSKCLSHQLENRTLGLWHTRYLVTDGHELLKEIKKEEIIKRLLCIDY